MNLSLVPNSFSQIHVNLADLKENPMPILIKTKHDPIFVYMLFNLLNTFYYLESLQYV